MKHIEMIIDYVTDGSDYQYNDNHGVLIRCHDCKYYQKNIPSVNGHYNGCGFWLDNGNEIRVEPDDYCSYGERGEQDEP